MARLAKIERATLRSKPVRISGYCLDTRAVLMGPEKHGPMYFSRKLSVLDLETGEYGGNCSPVDAREIVVSEKGKELLGRLLRP